MAIKTTNLGVVKAIHVGLTPPSNLNIIWKDTSLPNQKLKEYNTSTLAWEELVNTVLIDNDTIKRNGSDELYVDPTVLPALSVANGSITLLKMANVATATVFYRKTAGTGIPEVQPLATLKTDLGLVGDNTGDQDLSGYVPNTRTINAKPLTGNIVLDSTDIGSPAGSGTSTGTNTGDETISTIKSKLEVTVLSGENTGDQDLSGLVAKVADKSLVADAEITRLSFIRQNVYSILMSATGSVAIRVAGIIEVKAGGEAVAGWTFASDVTPTHLKITHSLVRDIASVSVFSIEGTAKRQLLASLPYSGIVANTTSELIIENLTTIGHSILIQLIFA
jgi:hypothetical protein